SMQLRAHSLGAAAALLSVTVTTPSADWHPTLRPAAALDGPVHALHLHDGGGGATELFAGGSFHVAGDVAASAVARWEGAGWSALAGGIDGEVYAMETFDDGSGPALYVGGDFLDAGGSLVHRIARWDGAAWSPLGEGIQRIGYAHGTYVADLIAFDDGSGPSLFAAGWFNVAGGRRAYNVARWDGAAWHPVGNGTSNGVLALEVFDDGTGPALYAGGFFLEAGGQHTWGIARWDGASWSPVGDEIVGSVSTLCVHDDGSGPKLYAGGTFSSAPWAPANFERLARFDGASWEPVGGPVTGPYGTKVNSLCVFDDGSGPALFVGGLFWDVDGLPANHVARWDGLTWSDLGPGVDGRVDAMAVAPSPSGGRALFVGGDFSTSPAGDAFFARWER
ncbi:MAG: hypothetical protein AAGB93_18340, partial [Planctomycetota bacterium]